MKTIRVIAKNAEQAKYYLKEIKAHPAFKNRKVKIVSNAWFALDGLNYQDTVFMLVGGYEKSGAYNHPVYRQYVDLGAEEMIWEEVKHAAVVPTSPLLEIKVQDMNSIPEVWLNGKKIEGRIKVEYEWETGSLDDNGRHFINLVYFDKNERATKTIGLDRLAIK